jgi:hypothetical protein
MKKIIWFFLDTLRISDVIQLKMVSYLRDMGWFNSFFKKEAVDRNNQPIPWCTYPYISFIGPRLKNTFSVFEFGSGNSTKWLSKRVADITSIEHDKVWFDKLQNTMPSNVQLIYKELTPNGEYANYIKGTGKKYDIIVVDGRDRINCVKNSVDSLSDNGVLVLDNSNVPDYSEAIQFLMDNNFKRLDFHGMFPIITISGSTTIFYKANNCLGI